MVIPFVLLITFYQRLLSPLIRSRCRFYPSCSSYARETMERHGLFFGIFYTIKRLLRCHPLCEGGHDPVPPSKEKRKEGIPYAR